MLVSGNFRHIMKTMIIHDSIIDTSGKKSENILSNLSLSVEKIIEIIKLRNHPFFKQNINLLN